MLVTFFSSGLRIVLSCVLQRGERKISEDILARTFTLALMQEIHRESFEQGSRKRPVLDYRSTGAQVHAMLPRRH